MTRRLPAGTLTFLFTDVEGSTRLLHELGPNAYAAALAEHRRVCRDAFGRHGGVEVDTQGDAFFVAFSSAPAALAAAREAMEALASGPIRVRLGLHTGTPLRTEEGYVGIDVHRAARIAAAGHGGQVLVSAETAALVERGGLRDLGEHRFKDLAEPERVFQLGDADFPPLKSLYRTNLPVPATALVGREREVAEVAALLTREDVRLLTLIGPGGTGKTRLALQAAAEASEHFPDGLTWVGLAPVRDPALLLTAVAQALELREQPGVPLAETLQEYLRDRQALLLLDNLEQLLPGAAALTGLLRACSRLRLLVTSRAPLRLSLEREYAVHPLAEDEAVALFEERVRAVAPGFSGNGAVVEICRRLDCLPLALELAAARGRVLSPEQLVARLSRRLPLLSGGPRDAPARQQTLRATITWSYELLVPTEQQLFTGLAVFVGGCTLEAAEAVCGADLDSLQSLVEKSLLRHTGERFWMLETIREFAADLLDESGAAAEMRGRHAEHYCALAEQTEPTLRGRGQALGFAWFEEEEPNLRQALDVAQALDEAELELRLAGACWYFWYMTTRLREGGERLEHAHGRSAGEPPALRAPVLDGLSMIAERSGDLASALAVADESLGLRRALGEVSGLLRSLLNRGLVGLASQDLSAGRAFLGECAELARKVGDEWFTAATTFNLADLALQERDFAEAERLAAEAHAAMRRLGDDEMARHALGNVALAELGLGKVEAASARLCALLRAAVEEQAFDLTMLSFDGLVEAAEQLGEDELAARLIGAVFAAAEARGFVIPASASLRRTLRGLRSRLDSERLATLLAKGDAMSLDEAIELALTLDPGSDRGSFDLRTSRPPLD